MNLMKCSGGLLRNTITGITWYLQTMFVGDFVNSLSDELMNIFSQLEDDKKSFEKMGITFEEKAFYDILIKVRDTHKFDYADEEMYSSCQSHKTNG